MVRLHLKGTLMSVTLIALITVKDKEPLALYREKAGAALAKHGGSIVTAGPVTETIEGPKSDVSISAIISFPSSEAAHAWISDPELADVHALRNKAGLSQILLLG